MDKLRKFLPVFYGTALIGTVFLIPSLAFAQAGPATLSDTFNSVGKNLVHFPKFLSLASYTIGLAFIALGLKKFKMHVDNPQQTPFGQGATRLFVGGLLMAAPSVAPQLIETFGWGDTIAQDAQGLANAAAAPNAGGVSLDVMMYNFIRNVRGPLGQLIFFIAYILGGWLITKGLMKSIRYADDGPKGQPGMGIVALLSVGAALMAMPGVLDTVGHTLNLGTTNVQFNALSFNGNGNPGFDPASVNRAAVAIFAFVQVIGLIGLVRGINMLRVIGEGGQQNASMPAAITHIVGGAIAWNIASFTNVLSDTLGIQHLIT